MADAISSVSACLRCGATGGFDQMIIGADGGGLEEGDVTICGHCGNLAIVERLAPFAHRNMTLQEFGALQPGEMASLAISSVFVAISHREEEEAAAAVREAEIAANPCDLHDGCPYPKDGHPGLVELGYATAEEWASVRWAANLDKGKQS